MKLTRLLCAVALISSSYFFTRPAFASVLTVTNTSDGGSGSLRQAILDANSNPGADTITFSIGSGPVTISPDSSLPEITDPVVIDGSTQPGFDGSPIVELDGTNIASHGLNITAGNSTVRYLAINSFGSDGIYIGTNGGNVVEGNFIGTDISGTIDYGNSYGIFIYQSPNNIIGGTTVGAGNLISGSSNGIGVEIYGSAATGNLVQGNFIGTDISGTAAIPNYVGLNLTDAPNNTIGGMADYAGNLISGNSSSITIGGDTATGNVVQGNAIGTDASGTRPLPNFYGVLVTSPNNTIGGTAAGAANLIAYSETSGVTVSGNTATGNAILTNSIFENNNLGISLGGYAPTPNDPGDTDVGANNLQNYPVLASAVSANGSITIQGSLNSTPNASFRLEFFDNSSSSPSRYGEGENFLGYRTVTTDGSGNAGFSVSFSTSVPVGDYIAATATDPGNNTSEFSKVTVVGPLPSPASAPSESLGGVLTSAPDAASWAPGRLDVFARGTDNQLWHKWWDGNAWSYWEPLGGVLTSAPTAVSWGPDRIDVFGRGTDAQMWHKWWDGNTWSGWEPLGGALIGGPDAASWAPGRLDVFARGTDNQLWHKWWDATNWSRWEPLGGNLDADPTAVSWGQDRIDLFIKDINGGLRYKWYDHGRWWGWEYLGGILTSAPDASSWGPYRLDIFARGTDNKLWHKWYEDTYGFGWEPLGGSNLGSDPSAISWDRDRIDVFAKAPDGTLLHRWWAGPYWRN
jgi:hypothetical protein